MLTHITGTSFFAAARKMGTVHKLNDGFESDVKDVGPGHRVGNSGTTKPYLKNDAMYTYLC